MMYVQVYIKCKYLCVCTGTLGGGHLAQPPPTRPMTLPRPAPGEAGAAYLRPGGAFLPLMSKPLDCPPCTIQAKLLICLQARNKSLPHLIVGTSSSTTTLPRPPPPV